MRVLITGIDGFAGRHLAERCAARGATVTGAGRRAAGDSRLAPDLEYVECDLLDEDQVDDCVREAAPERVFHLAAEAAVARSWADPAGTITRNVEMSVNLLEAIRHHARSARVLLACSGEEYGEPDRLPIDEEHPLRPRNPYAVSKAAVDLLGGLYQEAHGVHVVRTRAFNHTGPGQSDAYVVSSFARQIAEAEARSEPGAEVEIVTGNIDVRRDFTDVRDVVAAYWLALEHADAGVYNVARNAATAVADILASLAAQSQLRVSQRTDPERLRPHDTLEVRASHDKLTQATGWQPAIPLEQTLRDTLDWWRAQVAAGVA
jgi:GDP-4-dehydro-6-deoxy-D-mannose reductase